MLKTVHAGEAFGPESIFEALNITYADRLGAWIPSLFPDKIRTNKVRTQAQKEAYVESLIHYVSNRRLTIEVCISSNMQTNPEIQSISEHHFGKMLAHKMSVSLCTDNRLVSHTTVTDEYALALEHFEIDAKQLRDIVTYGFKRSFFAGTYLEKRQYIRQCIDYFDQFGLKRCRDTRGPKGNAIRDRRNSYLRLLNMDDAGSIFQLTEQNRAYLSEWLPWVEAHRQ